MARVGLVVIGVLCTGWLALILTTHGLLISSTRHLPANASHDALTCSYFTGLSVVKKEYWYSENGVMGRAVCPRLYSF